MISELGHFALILALAMALAQSVLPLIGAKTGNAAWMSLARPSAFGQFLFVAVAYSCLTYAFINNDFSVLLAAQHSNSTLPLIYRITAVWGNHEGSILLWSLILAGSKCWAPRMPSVHSIALPWSSRKRQCGASPASDFAA